MVFHVSKCRSAQNHPEGTMLAVPILLHSTHSLWLQFLLYHISCDTPLFTHFALVFLWLLTYTQNMSCLMTLALIFLFLIDMSELAHHSQVKFTFSMRTYLTLNCNLLPLLWIFLSSTYHHLTFVVFIYCYPPLRTVSFITAAFLVCFGHSYGPYNIKQCWHVIGIN